MALDDNSENDDSHPDKPDLDWVYGEFAFEAANKIVECGEHRNFDFHLDKDEPSCKGCKRRRDIMKAILG